MGERVKRILVLSASSAAASGMVPVLVISSFGDEIRTASSWVDLVDLIFPLAKFAQFDDLIFPKARRKRIDSDVGPWAAISRSPEPMIAVKIIVTAADEKDVVRNTHRHVRLRFGQQDHGWRRVHNYRRRLADMDIDVYLGQGRYGEYAN